MEKDLSNNLWKFFIFSLSQRRHFIPILAIYFLTLPNTNAQQIGTYVAIGYFASFLFEIPSGYFADIFGHKRTLILAKILMILSLFSFIFAQSLYHFIAGSALLSLSFAATSGTSSAFIHNTISCLNKEKEFTKIMSKIAANVSLASALLIILLPFLTEISIVLPLKINLIFDLIGLVAVLSLKSPEECYHIAQGKPQSFFHIVKTAIDPKFYPTAIFVGSIGGFIMATNGYRYVYLESLGYPIILIGFVMGLSRLFWFFIGHNAHLLEQKIGMKKIFKIEIFLFPLILLSTSYFSNPYLNGFMFSLLMGYFWGRNHLINGYFLKNFLNNKHYKATMLSVKNQIQLAFQIIVAFGISFVMRESYKIGYLTLGILLFVILMLLYPYLEKTLPN
ncbi:hypothetical protein CEE44_00420 [Candidatus Woesearchaeota archaeon B3_Woes]|nr:MAG: hypothetical protein CEE44_00420 [Candidatus Woesearchaeota archaeon B3_Woes]